LLRDPHLADGLPHRGPLRLPRRRERRRRRDVRPGLHGHLDRLLRRVRRPPGLQAGKQRPGQPVARHRRRRLQRAHRGHHPGAASDGRPAGRDEAARTLNQSTQFTAVGYGNTEYVNGPGGQTTTRPQARNYAVSSFNSLTTNYLHLSQHTKKGEGGTCSGDSGGPNFLGDTNIIASITVTGDTYCSSTNVGYRLDTQSARDFLDDFVTLP